VGNGSQGTWSSEGALSDRLWAVAAKAAQRYRCCQMEGQGARHQLPQEALAQTAFPCHVDKKNGPRINYFGHVFNN